MRCGKARLSIAANCVDGLAGGGGIELRLSGPLASQLQVSSLGPPGAVRLSDGDGVS